MKKRNIIIISVSVITLLFGGLVSLAVASFPELIEVEKEEIEQSHEDVLFDLPTLSDEKESKEEVVLTSSQGQSATYTSPIGDINVPISRHSFKGEMAFTADKEAKIISSFDHQQIYAVEAFETFSGSASSYTSSSFISSRNNKDNSDRPILNKETKQEAIHREVNSSAIMNTTIMAIGLCELLSFILVMKRKRHLRYR